MAEKEPEKQPEKQPEKAAPQKREIRYEMLENIRHGGYFEAGTVHPLEASGIPQALIAEWLTKGYIREVR